MYSICRSSYASGSVEVVITWRGVIVAAIKRVKYDIVRLDEAHNLQLDFRRISIQTHSKYDIDASYVVLNNNNEWQEMANTNNCDKSSVQGEQFHQLNHQQLDEEDDGWIKRRRRRRRVESP